MPDRHEDDDDLDEHRPHFRGRLAFVIVAHITKKLLRMERRIMAAIDDLNAKVDQLATAEAAVEATVSQLRATQGTPDDQVAAVSGKLQPIIDALNTLANPPAPNPGT